jgi:hypothetical protein
MIVVDNTSGEHFGREVVLVKQHYQDLGTFWETFPRLTRISADGRTVNIGWHEKALMPLDEPKLHGELNLERRKDVRGDPRMANYILGKEAGYNWGQRFGEAKKSPDEPA